MSVTSPIRAIGFLSALLSLTPNAAAHEGARAELARANAQLATAGADAYVAKAAAHRRLLEFHEAHAALGRAIAHEGLSPRIRLERAELFALEGRWEDLDGEASSALQLQPSARLHELRAEARVRRGEDLVGDLLEAARLGPGIDRFLAAARALVSSKRPKEAMQLLEEGVRKHEGTVALREPLVDLLLATGHAGEALLHIDAHLDRVPGALEWRLHRANALSALGRHSAAHAERLGVLSAVDAALARRPTDLQRLTRARVLIALQRTADARTELARIRPNPATADAHRRLAAQVTR